ncbi:MAG: hypothetical protein M3228_05040 [Actinomycetota bacterium]|nr:hypothetical protein [Actinomycetota bacterium]
MSFCDACGRTVDEGEHIGCARRRELEPPRYCPECARRMLVQVTPTSWSARCSAHGAQRRSR